MSRRATQGQTLIIVLWVMGVVSIAVGSVVLWATHELRLAQFPAQRVRQQGLLEAGVADMMARLRQDDATVDVLNACGLTQLDGFEARPPEQVPVGEGTFSIGQAQEEGWCTGLLDEERKLSLNQAPAAALQSLISTLLPDVDAALLAAAILDWRDEEIGPACTAATPPCRNAPLVSVDELRLVPGMTAEVFTALEPYVTVYGAGQVNANTASVLVLQALGYDGEGLAAQRAGAPFTAENPPPPGLLTAATAFTIPVHAISAEGAPALRAEAIIDRTGHILAWHLQAP